MENIFKMAGERAAHAMWSVSDGEVLIPILSFLDKENQTQMQRLAFSDAEEAVAYGKEHLDANETGAKAAVLIHDGYVHVNEVKNDALLVTIKGYEPSNVDCIIAMPYRPKTNSDSFEIYRPLLYDYPAEHKELVHQHMDHFFEGIEGHELAYKIWQEFYTHGSSKIGTVGSESKSEMDKGEWELLCLAPYLVFLTVAAADGTIDQKEVKALGKILGKPHPSEYINKVIAETVGDVSGIINLIIEKQWNTIDVLEKITHIVDSKLNENEGLMFKLDLLNIGQEIAKASGGGFLGIGKKVSKEEQGALAAIAQVLKVL